MFGGRSETRVQRDENRHMSNEVPCGAKSEVPQLGVTGCGTEAGLKVIAVRSGSPAAQGGVVPGDILTMIDGRPVQNSHDIAVAIAANPTGVVKITYLIQGNWATVREVKVP
jgi:putative serine protease PepD